METLDYAPSADRAIKRIRLRTIHVVVGLGLILLIGYYVFIATAIGGFGPGEADASFGLPGDLRLVRTSRNRNMLVGPPNAGGRIPLAGVLIPCDLTALGWNDHYLICERMDVFWDADLGTEHTENSQEWWVIDLRRQGKYGPFSREKLLSEYGGIRPSIAVYPIKAFGTTGQRDPNASPKVSVGTTEPTSPS